MSVLVLGAGGHSKVVADILLCIGAKVLGFLDDDPRTWGQRRLGLPVLGAISTYAEYEPDGLAMGLGHNHVRQGIAIRLDDAAKGLWINAIHPRTTLAASVQIGKGVVLAAGAIVNPDTIIGDYAIVNTGATVDHDCFIGDYAHIAPGVHMSGGVSIGEGTLIGVGASIAPGCSVGKWAVVGAGAVVVRNIPDGVTAKGVPARW